MIASKEDIKMTDTWRGAAFAAEELEESSNTNQDEDNQLPLWMRKQLVEMLHEGHPGFQKTYHRVKARFDWPNMKKDVREYVTTCRPCLERKMYAEKKRSLKLVFNNAFERVYLDLKDLSKQPSGEYKYVLVILDAATRWVELIPLKTKGEMEVSRAFYDEWICRWGFPVEVKTDQGKEFMNSVFRKLTVVTGMEHIPARIEQTTLPVNEGLLRI